MVGFSKNKFRDRRTPWFAGWADDYGCCGVALWGPPARDGQLAAPPAVTAGGSQRPYAPSPTSLFSDRPAQRAEIGSGTTGGGGGVAGAGGGASYNGGSSGRSSSSTGAADSNP